MATPTMQHWYVEGPREMVLVEEPIPSPAAGQVLIRVTHTALSPGSNLHGFVNRPDVPQRSDVVYMGSGVIEAVGEGVDSARIGERVTCTGIGHQQFGVVAAAAAHRVPEGVSMEVASLSYLAAWSVSVLHLGDYAAADGVAVVGLGLVGASAAMVANAMGARVQGLDTLPERLAFAEKLGLGDVADPRTLGPTRDPEGYFGTVGPDLVIEATGSWGGVRTALDRARDYSRIALMGMYRELPPPELGAALFADAFSFPSKMHYQRVKIVGCGSDPDSFAEPMPRMATRASNARWVLEQVQRGRLELDRLITSVVPAGEVQSMLDRLVDGDRSQIGVVFDWQGV